MALSLTLSLVGGFHPMPSGQVVHWVRFLPESRQNPVRCALLGIPLPRPSDRLANLSHTLPEPLTTRGGVPCP